MKVPCLRFSVRWMMATVAIFALVMFVLEEIERYKTRFVDANSGRFLVVVKTFRGHSAKSEAGKLAFELRHRHGLPAYVLVAGDLRRARSSPQGGARASVRRTEEVAVLIGDCETKDDCDAVREILRSTDAGPALTWLNKRMAFQASNPYVPLQTMSER